MRHAATAGVLGTVLLLAAGVPGCEGRSAVPPPPAPDAHDRSQVEAEARAARAADRLAGAVMGELQKALGAGPPEEAVRVCGEAAARVAAEVAAAEGMTVRRTALRLRNPANAPDAHERAALEGWARSNAKPAPRADVVADPEGGRALRYLRPIVLQPMCVLCHGAPEEVPAAVRTALAERYPEDRATGFRPGELRGAVSVTVPLGPP